MACRYLRGLLAPHCAARDHSPVPSVVEEIRYCLDGEEESCPHYRRARQGERNVSVEEGPERRGSWDWAP